MRNFQSRNSGIGIISGFAIEALFYIILFIISAFVAALFALRAESPMDAASVYSIPAVVVSAAFGGFILSKIRGEGGVKHAVISAALAASVLFIIGLITGGMPGVSAMINYISFVGIAGIFAFLGRKRERRHKRRRAR